MALYIVRYNINLKTKESMKNFNEGYGHHKATKNEVKKVMSARNAARSLAKNISILPKDGITIKDGNNIFHISDKSVETFATIVKMVLENPALLKEHGDILLSLAGKVKYADTLLRDQEKKDNMAEFLRVTQPEKVKDFE